MALTAREIQDAYVTFFNRAADTEGFTYWTSYPGSISDLYATFALQTEYTSVYGGKTAEQQITTVYQNLFDRAPDAEGLAYWKPLVEAGTISVANLALTVNRGAQGTDTTALSGKIDAAIVTTDAAVAANLPGQTFTLTTSADTLTGTAQADTFNAAVLTAGSGDSVSGGEGADVLNVETSSSLTENFKTDSIETINVNALGATTIDTKNMKGLVTLNSNDAAGAVTVSNIASADTKFGIKGAATNNLTLNYATGALNGTSDNLSVNLNGASATTLAATAGFESVELNVTAKSSLTSLSASGVTQVTISGGSDMTISDSAITATDYVITNTGKVTLGTTGTIKTFNAAANTGGIVASSSGTDTTSGLAFGTSTKVLSMHSNGGLLQTGSGNDLINVDSSSVFSTGSTIVKLGAGNDNVRISAVSSSGEYIYGEAGDDTIYAEAALTSADLIDGGEGTDTVKFAAGTHGVIAKGIEKVEVKGATTVSFVTIDTAVDIVDTDVAAVSFSNLKSGTTYTHSGTQKTGDLTLGFATSQAATVEVDLTKGTTGSISTTNAKDVTVNLGAASAFNGKSITVDSAATSLKLNATGALTNGGTALAFAATAATATAEKLQTLTVSGNKEVTLGAITNDKALTSVSAKSTGGAVTLGAIGASGNTEADVTVTKIEAISGLGKAVIGAIDFSGVATTVTGSIGEITASGTGGTAAATTIGAIVADTLGTVTATSSNSDATIGAITAGLDTAADTTDGTVSALKASAFHDATIANILADKVDSIIVESTNTTTAKVATLGSMIGANGVTKVSVGSVDISTKSGAATWADTGTATTAGDAVIGSKLGNVTVTGATAATVGKITISNTANDSTMGNLTVTAGTGDAKVGIISAEVAGDVGIRSGSGNVVASSMTFADTTGVSVTMDASGAVAGTITTLSTGVTAGAATIDNSKGDLTLTLKSSSTAGAGHVLTAKAGTATATDIDINVDASAVKGNLGATGGSVDFTVTNDATDSASSIVVKGGAASNWVTLDGDGGTISYQGQGGADTVTLTGTYTSSTIYLEGGADVLVLGAGQDAVYSGAGADAVTLNAATINSSKLDAIYGYEVNTANEKLVTGGTAAVWDDVVTGWTITNGVFTKSGATVADFYAAVAAVTGTAAEVAAFVSGGNTYIFGEGAATGDADNVAIVLMGVEATAVGTTAAAATVLIG